jgi:hypothetical protein
MKRHLTVFILIFINSILFAQKQPLSYYYSDNPIFDKNIPSPEDFLGYQIGEQHISHDQLVAYMRELDRLSDRISLQITGKTYENRPLMILTITSPANHQNLEKIRTEHLKLIDPAVSAGLDVSKMPVVVYQGHSIHGNEASGANAGVLAAYYWAAAQGKEVEETLNNVVILFDPSFNPDGLQRFSQWVNMHRSKNLVTDPASREFSEVWPYGRTNHYWFDLNRDWLVSQLPESQARLPIFHAWKPNILTDHHEMGSNASFFFQPGVPARVNPYTPAKNFELTGKIAEFHAKALNKIGSQYYTKQGFDDFYYGKGSTYPDVQGCIGILFEQASSRGHAQRTVNGVLTFPFTIRNQLTTSFSTIEAAKGLRTELLTFQRDFYKNAMDEARRDAKKAYVFGDKYDKTKTYQFVELLRRSHIKVYELGQNVKDFEKNNAFIVPLAQTQYKLIKASFEKYVEGKDGFFADSLFYDISAWTLPLAFNISSTTVEAGYSNNFLGKEITSDAAPEGDVKGGQSDYGYAFEYDDYLAPKLLNALLKEDLIVKVSTMPFKVETTEGVRAFNHGAIYIPAKNQSKSSEFIFNSLQNMVKKTGVNVHSLKTGLSTEGVDLGSPSILNVRKPNVAMLVGEGVSNNDAGEVWHLLDTRYDMNLTLLDVNNIGRINLTGYTCIITVDGIYTPAVAAKLKDYINSGGTIAAFGRAIKFLKNNDLCAADFKTLKNTSKEKEKRRPYAQFENDEGSQVIGGAIFDAEGDLSHPLLYGYRTKALPVFRADTLFMDIPNNAYAAPLIYTQNPLSSGYLSSKNKELSKGAASIVVSSVGSGRVIAMVDNPAFRAFWYGTNKLLANMIFFGNLIQSGTMETVKPPASATGNRE